VAGLHTMRSHHVAGEQASRPCTLPSQRPFVWLCDHLGL